MSPFHLIHFYISTVRNESLYSQKKKKNLTNLNNELKLSDGIDGQVYLTTTSQRYGIEDCLKILIP